MGKDDGGEGGFFDCYIRVAWCNFIKTVDVLFDRAASTIRFPA